MSGPHLLPSHKILWLGILGPASEESAVSTAKPRSKVLISRQLATQQDKLEDLDNLVVQILSKTPSSSDGTMKLGRINSRFKVVNVKRDKADISFAAIGTDAIELLLFVELLEKNCLQCLGYEDTKSLSVSLIKAKKLTLLNMFAGIVQHGNLVAEQAQQTVKMRKAVSFSSKATPSDG